MCFVVTIYQCDDDDDDDDDGGYDDDEIKEMTIGTNIFSLNSITIQYTYIYICIPSWCIQAYHHHFTSSLSITSYISRV